MDENDLQSRLSRISTVWTLLAGAGRGPALNDQDPRAALIRRYQGAAYRYLLAAVRDPDVADELFQEFALRVMQGRFAQADSAKGRFRDYLKSALIHLVTDYHRGKRKRLSLADPAAVEAEDSALDPAVAEQSFVASLRDELLARAWAALAEAERRGGQPFHSVLRFRAEHPELRSPEMAARLNAQLRPKNPLSETSVRKTLQRARAEFADVLLDDVVHSLGNPSFDELQRELIDLGLLSYCRSALARRQGQC